MKSKQVLDVQQMQHLQELGLALKGTMLYWVNIHKKKKDWFVSNKPVGKLYADECIPAYTLQDVLDALPKEIMYGCKSGYKRCWLSIDLADEEIEYYNENVIDKRHSVHFEFYGSSNLIDAAYSLLCWCIENGYIETNKN